LKKKKRRQNKMEWQFIVAMVIAVPVILFPAAFVWYANLGGLMQALKERRARAARAAKITA
jgi:hypothetical protein